MTSDQFSAFLKEISSQPLSVLDAEIPIYKYRSLNLSNTNSDLRNVDLSSSKALEVYIHQFLRNNEALVAYGGYNEVRDLYQRSNYFNQANPEADRNIHMGMDLWIAADTPIFTPLNATVHSFKNNQNHGDYGPTIILKHQIHEVEFYTLYGHLSLDSITDLSVGQAFKEGGQIARLGGAAVNGDYPPHLHFQIIRELQDWQGDYPGVCNKNNLEFYLRNCPDPNMLLKLNSH